MPNYKEKAVQSQIKTLNNQLTSQKDLLSIKESQYREIYAKRGDLEESISKLSSNLRNMQYNDNNQGLNALEYLYQSYILEIDNMENDFIRKQSLGEIRTKDIKIQKLVEQLKIRDEYIKEEKKISGKKSEDSSKNKPHINNEHPEIKPFNEKQNNKNKDLKKVENKKKFGHSQLGPIEHKKREKEHTGNQNLDKNKEIKENKGTIGKSNIKSHAIKPEDSGNVHVTNTHIQIESNSTPNKTGNEPSNKPKVDKSIELKEGKVNKNLNKRTSEKNIDSNNDKNKNSRIPIKSRKSNDITNQIENKNNNSDNRLTQNNKNNKLNSLVDETNKNKKLENKENNEAILKQLKQIETEKEKYKTLNKV